MGVIAAGPAAWAVMATTDAVAVTVALPNPCALVPAGVVAPALGVPKAGVQPPAQSEQQGAFPTKQCLYRHGKAEVVLAVEPAAAHSPGPTGMTCDIEHPSGLGPKGSFSTSSCGHGPALTVTFVKGSLYGTAFSNANVAPSAVLALGRYYYKHLA
jgi:hypothetical protein